MAQLVERYWTAEDVRALPEDGNRYECIDGVLLVTPAPSRAHQTALAIMYDCLRDFVRRHTLGALLWSPADIEIVPGTTVQPDLFVARTGTNQTSRGWGDVVGLRLAVEVVSPTTARRDRSIKREFYQRAGVEELWIVDLDARLVERWHPGSDLPETLRDRLVWAPESAAELLEIDLPIYFSEVLGD